ncbi:MAG: hypothetical protein KJO85_07085, partial [Gammaproteobacteria bacterium]|nr:hypothetical protein [Gammaproteobacteria bacterium]
MKLVRFSLIIAFSGLVLAGCNREEAAIAEAAAGNPLLAHVPAGTPYLYANLEPTPADVIDAFMARAEPSLEVMQTLLDDFEFEVKQEGDDMAGARLASAIYNELDGKLNRAGLESLGLDLESHVVMYGMGPFPVMRVTLADAQALRDSIGRIETAAGQSFTEQILENVPYWRISKADSPMSAIVSIMDDQLVAGLVPTIYEAEWLPQLLGLQMPAESTAAADLVQLNRDKGYSAYGSGFINLVGLAEEVLDETSTTAGLLQSLGHSPQTTLDDVCKAEFRSIVAKMPRLVAGTTELSADVIGISYQLEIENSLAEKLTGLVADVPVADRDPGKVMTVAVGLKVGALKAFLTEQASAIVDSPYQCAHLQNANQQARTAFAQLSQPVPFPFINNLKGFRASLDEIDYENFQPENVRGLFALEVEKPQMLIGMAQMFIPGMEELDLQSGSDPVALPQELLTFASGGMKIYAAMG